MNTPLVPCPDCQRHVRVGEGNCPFCGAAVDDEQGAAARVSIPTKRLGSLAIMMFRTTALGAAIVACGGDDSSKPATDSGSDVGSGGSTGAGGTFGIGGAPTDNTGGGMGTGGSPGTGGVPGTGGGLTGSGGSTPFDGGPVPIYRATPRGS
jgi:endogenous inhibitor of DNA gyrase (YacG/DUF329 family)